MAPTGVDSAWAVLVEAIVAEALGAGVDVRVAPDRLATGVAEATGDAASGVSVAVGACWGVPDAVAEGRAWDRGVSEALAEGRERVGKAPVALAAGKGVLVGGGAVSEGAAVTVGTGVGAGG